MNDKKIDVAVVTLFNPDSKVIGNIESYIPYVKELLIVDNSSKPFDIGRLDNGLVPVKILSSGVNLGVSRALNLALEYAEANNYRWMLTMDQDSYFTKDEIEKYINLFHDLNKRNLAIFSPLHNQKFLVYDKVDNKKKDAVLTSANIVNIQKAIAAGSFDENLFIDEVDHDLCLRLGALGYDIIQNNNCFVHHSLGTKNERGIAIYLSKRLYYMSRNYLYVRKKYKKSVPNFFKKRDFYLLKFFVKQVFYSKKRVKSTVMIFKGIKDYYLANMGYRVKF